MHDHTEKILCISDSFGLPREGVEYNDTWIALIKRHHKEIDFISLFRRQLTTDSLSEQNYGEFLKFYSPDYVYVQLGICDCAPRYIRTKSLLYRILRRLPSSFSSIVWKLIKLRGRRLKCTDVSLNEFYTNLSKYVEECQTMGVKQIILCKIGKPAENMLKSNPHVLQSINNFNNVIEQIKKENNGIIEIVDPLNSGDKDNYVLDGYHPNKLGHKLIYKSLDQILKTV